MFVHECSTAHSRLTARSKSFPFLELPDVVLDAILKEL